MITNLWLYVKSLIIALFYILGLRFESRGGLEAEVFLLSQQLDVLGRRPQRQARLMNADCLLFVWLYRILPSFLNRIRIAWKDKGLLASPRASELLTLVYVVR